MCSLCQISPTQTDSKLLLLSYYNFRYCLTRNLIIATNFYIYTNLIIRQDSLFSFLFASYFIFYCLMIDFTKINLIFEINKFFTTFFKSFFAVSN